MASETRGERALRRELEAKDKEIASLKRDQKQLKEDVVRVLEIISDCASDAASEAGSIESPKWDSEVGDAVGHANQAQYMASVWIGLLKKPGMPPAAREWYCEECIEFVVCVYGDNPDHRCSSYACYACNIQRGAGMTKRGLIAHEKECHSEKTKKKEPEAAVAVAEVPAGLSLAK